MDGCEDTLYPVATRAKSGFDDLYPLSVKPMLDDQVADKEVMKEVSASIKKKNASILGEKLRASTSFTNLEGS